MKTQEFILPANPAMDSRSSAPRITTDRTADRVNWVDEDIGVSRPVFAAKKQQGHLGQLIPLEPYRYPQRHSAPPLDAPHRWCIVLAGHDDTSRSDLPLQFRPFLGSATLLDKTRYQAEQSVLPERIVYSVTRAHEQYYLPSLRRRPSERIVQPSDKGTAPAILSSLLHIVRRDPNAIVAILPCENYFSPESAFNIALESAFEISERRSRFAVVLGVEPKSPDVDQNWIETGEPIGDHAGMFSVEGLWEKPSLPLADSLLRSGSLWNTSVMVGHVCTLLEIAWAMTPGLLQVLESAEVTASGDGEIRIQDAAYDGIAPMDFSRVLPDVADRLLALRLDEIEWTCRVAQESLTFCVTRGVQKRTGNGPHRGWQTLIGGAGFSTAAGLFLWMFLHDVARLVVR